MANHEKIADLQKRITTERKIIAGFQAMRSATSNQDTIRSCDSKIRDSEKNIRFFEESIRELQAHKAGGGGASSDHGGKPDSGYASSHRSGGSRGSERDHLPIPGYGNPQGGKYATQAAPPANGPRLPKATYTNLDLCKADTPLTGAKINRMLVLLEFKLSVEAQYKQGIEKMQKLYQVDGDKKSRGEAEAKRVESNQKMLLLQQALKKYKSLEVIGIDDDDAGAEERSGVHRRALTGTLEITITSAKDLDHAPLPKRGKAISESVVVMKVEDAAKARTHPSRNDRWNEEFEIYVDKANEIEITIYDKLGNETPIPIGLAWIRLSDVVEELRRKKVGNDSGPGWVTAARVSGGGSQPENQPGGGGMGSAGGMAEWGAPGGGPGGMTGSPNMSQEGIDAWFEVEPAGAIGLHLNFVKSNVRKRPLDAGGLGRQGAVRKRKEEVHEQNGHKFIAQQFYGGILTKCALCSEFLYSSSGMQCEDCKYLCHKKCFSKVVTKCISKSNADTTDFDDDKMLNHRIPHRFEPFANVAPNWCCHCGFLLPLGRKSARKCSECSLTSHADCAHLVPDFCGMSMEMANRLLQEIKTARSRQVGRMSAGGPKQDSIAGRPPPPPSQQTGPPPPSPHRIPPPSTSSSYDNLSQGMGRMQVQQPPPQDGYRRTPAPSGRPEYQDQPSYTSPSKERPAPPSAGSYQPPPSFQGGAPEEDSVVGSIFGDYAGPTPSISRPSSTGPPPQQQVRPLPPQPGQQAQRPYAPPPQQQPQPSPARLPPGAGAPSYSQDQRHSQGPPAPQPQVSSQPPQHQQRPSQQIATQQPPQSPAQQRPAKMRKVGLDDFNFLAVLGKGNFGKVMLAEEKRSNSLYAIKVLKKDFIIENDEVESTKSEKRVFITASRERHPFLIGLHSCFQTETRIYFVMEYVSGGDLMLHIQREQFTPRRAKFYAAEVLLALEYFHKNGIVYRDLKLDNILLTLDGHVKVADYGLCKEEMWYQSTTSTFCGTPEFMAPEILLEQRYGRAVDWWAFGVLIYEMLLGQSPFKGDDEDEIFDAILEDEPLYPIHMPRDSVQILQRLLTREPHRRLGSGPTDAEEIKAHAFFRDTSWSDVYYKRIPAPYFPTINGQTDVSNFDSEFTKESPRLTPVHSQLRPEDQKEFANFSWTATWAS